MPISAPTRELLAADSFRVRVREGRAEARGFSRHLTRFERTVHKALEGRADRLETARELDRFVAGARRRIQHYGAGFPRLELWQLADGAHEFEVALRPLPGLLDTIALRSIVAPPLRHPQLKGPHIAEYAAMNRALGAEALLHAPDGTVLEGATTSLLFWEGTGADSGRHIASTARVPSVTEALLVAAAGHGLPTAQTHQVPACAFAPRAPRVADLLTREVWAVNALHGVRPVTSIDGVPLPAPQRGRLARFAEALDRSWEPIKQ